jgi:hypothetical protein
MTDRACRARMGAAALLAVSSVALGTPPAMAAGLQSHARAQVMSGGQSIHRQKAGDFISATFRNNSSQFAYFWVNDEGANPPASRFSGYLTPGATTGPLDFYSGGWSSGTAGYGRWAGPSYTNARVSDGSTIDMD